MIAAVAVKDVPSLSCQVTVLLNDYLIGCVYAQQLTGGVLRHDFIFSAGYIVYPELLVRTPVKRKLQQPRIIRRVTVVYIQCVIRVIALDIIYRAAHNLRACRRAVVVCYLNIRPIRCRGVFR